MAVVRRDLEQIVNLLTGPIFASELLDLLFERSRNSRNGLGRFSPVRISALAWHR
jgi:hypothetical protein